MKYMLIEKVKHYTSGLCLCGNQETFVTNLLLEKDH